MKIIDSRYNGKLRTEAMHIKSGKIIITDAPTDNNGKGEAFSPTDLVAASLASCMMTIMGIIAEKESIRLDDLSAEVSKIMAATPPRRVAEIHINFKWGEPQGDERQIKKLKQGALTCPVALSLDKNLIQKVNFDF